jgi:hypothetical protein
VSSCNSTSPCIEYDNNGSGPGIRGISVGGNGLAGTTKFISTSATNAREGLIGNDISSSGSFNSGVKGMSVRGNGVLGQSTNNSGVEGVSTNADGVRALSTNGPAFDGFSNNSYGLNASTASASGGVAGVRGVDESTGKLNAGVAGSSTNGIGVSAVSSNYVGANVIGGDGGSLPALSIIGNGFGDFIDACSSGTANPCDRIHARFSLLGAGGIEVFGIASTADITADGNVDITGQYLKNGSCVTGCAVATATSPGRAVVSYVATQSQPSMDDFGEATLQNGSAYVRLDPAFANVIEEHANYLVFITPEGDSHGLYVTQKSARGFAVHENMGGQSSVAFSYRIVAKPLSSHEQRLPMVATPKLRRPMPSRMSQIPR